LERNEEIRRSLVADVAHELRTPLTILQGKLKLILEGAIKPIEEVVLELTDEVYLLNRLVSDLQQLSLAEAGKLLLNKQPANLKQLIDRIYSYLQLLADEKKITLKYDQISTECLEQIDADRMTQVIVSLIGNALRHTPEQGLVEICTRTEKFNLQSCPRYWSRNTQECTSLHF
jgi:two-component system sensor histidine kinase BaeS